MKLALTFLTALLLSPLAVVHAADSLQKPGKPNIVFIYADDWGWGDLSCHGNTWLKTPRLDKLASEGIDFQQFNVLSPVCSPSRAAAMTGRFPGRFGINTVFGVSKPPEMPDWLDSKATTIPRLLKKAGYRTGHFGKWHLGEGKPTMADYGMAKVLKAKGYPYQYYFCQDSGHGIGNARSQLLPSALEWLWQGYQAR